MIKEVKMNFNIVMNENVLISGLAGNDFSLTKDRVVAELRAEFLLMKLLVKPRCEVFKEALYDYSPVFGYVFTPLVGEKNKVTESDFSFGYDKPSEEVLKKMRKLERGWETALETNMLQVMAKGMLKFGFNQDMSNEKFGLIGNMINRILDAEFESAEIVNFGRDNDLSVCIYESAEHEVNILTKKNGNEIDYVSSVKKDSFSLMRQFSRIYDERNMVA